MANSGFSAMAQLYGEVSANIGELAPMFAADVPSEETFQGTFANAARERMAGIAAHMNSVADFAQSRVGIFNMQFDGDAKLSVAPTAADVQAAQDAWRQARVAGVPGALQKPLLDEAERIAAERNKALEKHQGTCSVSEGQIAASSVPSLPADPAVDGGGAPGGSDDPGKSKHGEGGVEDEPQPGDGTGDGTGGGDTFTPSSPSETATNSSMSDTAANTGLSSDTGLMNGAGAGATPQQALGQPMAQAPSAAGAGGGAAPAGTGIPSGSMLGAPNGSAGGSGSRGGRNRDKDKKDKEGITPGNLDGLFGVGAPVAAAAAVSGIDRGSSVSGVTTERPIDGKGVNASTALSGANGANPNNPNGLGSGSTARGMGPMGGGGMGPMGAGGGGAGGGTAKTPDIKATEPEPLAEQQQREAVEGGTLSRASASDPTKDEEKR